MSASKSIIDEYYGKNRKFSRAEDEMRLSMNAIRGRKPIHQHLELEQSRNADSASVKDVTVRLKRLTRQEIASALKGDLSHFHRSKSVADDVNTMADQRPIENDTKTDKSKPNDLKRKYNLRSKK